MAAERPAVFLSYRRTDAAVPARRLHDALATALGDDAVFMDVVAIDPGDDFVVRIADAIAACDALLVVVGPTWLAAADAAGAPRLDDSRDHVRREVEIGLAQGVRVVPVLVGGASMPSSAELPTPLAPLATRNGVRVDDATWDADVAGLLAGIAAWHAAVAPRTLTIVAADLASGTNLGEQLSSDAVRDVLVGVDAALTAAVRDAGGIARSATDMVFGFFVGPPEAAVDRARAALRAAFGGRRRVEELARRIGLPLRLRAAAHTAVVERHGAPDTLLVERSDLVATVVRMLDDATSGIVVSEATFALVGPFVAAEPAEPVRLRRLPHPIARWRVTAPPGA